jgi:membrane associated rhomboid family serine protease
MKPARRTALFEGVAVIVSLLAVMWFVEVVNAIDGQRLDADGIYPRSLNGLPGIVSAPFIHAGFSHLVGNTIPFIVLGLLIALEGARRVVEVTLIVALVAGLGTWLTAPADTSTIGASGIVFGYAGYLIARGVFTHRALQIAVGVVVAVLFGGALLWDLVPQTGVSWQDHLFGAIGGVVAAWLLDRPVPGRSAGRLDSRSAGVR